MPDWRSFSQLVCMSLCWIFEIIWMCLARVIERSYRGFTVAYRPVRLLAAVKFMPELESNQQQVYTEICCHICVGKHMPFFFLHVGSSSLSPGFQISWTRRPVSGDDAAAKQGIHQDPLWPGGGWKLRERTVLVNPISTVPQLANLKVFLLFCEEDPKEERQKVASWQRSFGRPTIGSSICHTCRAVAQGKQQQPRSTRD